MARQRIASIAVITALSASLGYFIVFPVAKYLGGIIYYSVMGLASPAPGAELSIVPTPRFAAQGETVAMAVRIKTQKTVNLVAATLSYPKEAFTDCMPSVKDSIINLWIKQPTVSSASGTVEFGGGIQRDEGGFSGSGVVLTVRCRASKTGNMPIALSKAIVLAHDGKGTDVLGDATDATVYVREADRVSPDLNHDNTVTLTDIGILMFHLGSRDNRYDVNGDGSVNWNDVMELRTYL